MLPLLYISLLFFAFVQCNSVLNITNTPICNTTFTHFNKTIITDLKGLCEKKPCIAKCCGENEIFYNVGRTKVICRKKTSIPNIPIGSDLWALLKIYKNDVRINIVESEKNLTEHFHWVHGQNFLKRECAFKYSVPILYKPLENGTLMIDGPNYYDRWINQINPLDYCVDFHLLKKKDGSMITRLRYKFLKTKQEGNNNSENTLHIFNASALGISCFFMIIVLVVYSLLPQLRNLVGMVLMAYVATLTLAYILKTSELVMMITNRITSEICSILSPMTYFAILSSFFWLNVMSLDIWWTFRGTHKCRDIHRRGEVAKFQRYSLYAWGIPALMAIAATVIDRVIPYDVRFVTPHFDKCFYQHDEVFIYFYLPIIIMTIINCVLFIMSIYNIWLISRNLSRFNTDESQTNKKNKNRFLVYLKMSVIMGISWMLEVVQMFSVDIPPWLSIILNFYNANIGVSIFCLFVFKKSILIMLCKRFNIKSTLVRSPNINSSVSRSYHYAKSYKRAKTTDVELK